MGNCGILLSRLGELTTDYAARSERGTKRARLDASRGRIQRIVAPSSLSDVDTVGESKIGFQQKNKSCVVPVKPHPSPSPRQRVPHET